MSTVTVTEAVQAPAPSDVLPGWTAPSVNLLPPEIFERARFKRVQLGLAAGVALTAAVVGLLHVSAMGATAEAERELQATVAEGAGLQAEVAELADVDVVYAKAAAARAVLTQAMGREVRYSTFLNDLTSSLPDDVWLTSVTFTQADPAPAAAGAAPATTATPGIGTAVLTGVGFSHDDVADWLDGLAEQKGYSNPYLTDSKAGKTGDRTTVTFTSTVTLTEAALSGRYTTEAD
jgi:Tfp pilus assembly protein PilN